jgi:hypothetical protein
MELDHFRFVLIGVAMAAFTVALVATFGQYLLAVLWWRA